MMEPRLIEGVDEFEKRMSNLRPAPLGNDRFITAHYYLEATHDIAKAAAHIAHHQSTSAGIFNEETLLGRCSAVVSNVQYLHQDTVGIVSISFPLAMFGEPLTSSEILHIVSGAVQNDDSHNRTLYLLDLEVPAAVTASFPGPAYGERLFAQSPKPILGTILKPCTGITLADYERIVRELVTFPELQFIKEDENLFPSFAPCPLAERVKIAARIVAASGRQIVFAPHITALPRQLLKNIEIVAEAGLKAVMFSETYYGGMVREARQFIAERGYNLAIYAHNGGIGTRTRSINRVLLDRLVRLDGADFRQTAPTGENCYLRPLSWQRQLVEDILTEPLSGKPATICVRAGGLDHGNLLVNLIECQDHPNQYMFLMGSAINSIHNPDGQVNHALGMGGIRAVLALWAEGVEVKGVRQLYRLAHQRQLSELVVCLEQRYDASVCRL